MGRKALSLVNRLQIVVLVVGFGTSPCACGSDDRTSANASNASSDKKPELTRKNAEPGSLLPVDTEAYTALQNLIGAAKEFPREYYGDYVYVDSNRNGHAFLSSKRSSGEEYVTARVSLENHPRLPMLVFDITARGVYLDEKPTASGLVAHVQSAWVERMRERLKGH